MAMYLMREALPPQAWTQILEGGMEPHPFAAPEVMNAGFETVGGKLHGLWLSVTTSEMVFIAELPDDVAAVACSLRYLQRSQYGPIGITPLLTPEQATTAIAKATALPKSFTVTGSDA